MRSNTTLIYLRQKKPWENLRNKLFIINKTFEMIAAAD